MIECIKKLFNKEEQKTPYELKYSRVREENWHKMNREKELFELFHKVMFDTFLIPGQKQIPYKMIYYIDKCIEYGMPQMALDGIKQMKWITYGTNIDLEPLEQRVYGSKEYKEMILKKKLEEMEKDFV